MQGQRRRRPATVRLLAGRTAGTVFLTARRVRVELPPADLDSAGGSPAAVLVGGRVVPDRG
ncbi:hypothetical protein [Streptosporangium canum]|uniref:hypothetical protein n=1 Tax=Streptosporangium canum TaxID=324952 RepID=UPI001C42ED59|nr:hypothetical protein [Streptosporangium canum]